MEVKPLHVFVSSTFSRVRCGAGEDTCCARGSPGARNGEVQSGRLGSTVAFPLPQDYCLSPALPFAEQQ